MKYDAIVVGAGIAGLVASTEIAQSGKRVLLVEQEPEASLGGQAWWSFGGLFLVNSPEQRRLGIKDSYELAWQDWIGTAGFDRVEDEWARKWAQAYVEFATYQKRDWLHAMGVRFFPVVGWAERGGGLASGHGNSVPRFHIVWGTGPGILAPFEKKLKDFIKEGTITYLPRHQVNHLLKDVDRVFGIEGNILKESHVRRGEASNREKVGHFHFEADAIVIASGGIGGNLELIRKYWPTRLGEAPKNMIIGVPAHVDGRMIDVAEQSGAHIVNRDRMWHYTEGIQNWNPVWEKHGIRILPGPSSVWLTAKGERMGAPNFPGFDTLSTLEAIQKSGYEYTWFILTDSIIEKEFALSGSEQNPDLTNKSIRQVLKRVLPGPTLAVKAFLEHGVDFVQAQSLEELVSKMNERTGDYLLDITLVKEQIEARDREVMNKFSKDLQIQAILNARNYKGDRLVRVAKPHPILSGDRKRLIAVRLNILSRKTLGGIQTDLAGHALNEDGEIIQGLFACGEAAGFGGGGMHGYRSLEGTFVGGCLFTGKVVGETISKL
ncbi:FAD-binding dehydrogenase [Alkalihalobacillus pseudalcaliphilus]|uniref:FAD-binding dehydrogenase n=1 Tax=Alkalihalobacillus pseudalcaliphilus TaxID=79884 RepID=UPI00064D90E0|nr:FAD-binding dehydrogenase [Alkalihalobacillus pseudalcaliphilus]KMK76216.1 FAD-binding dehydrogenase [Alkalihalobacillus pseudalcaliphilus]